MRILLADDQSRVRFALRTLLQQQPGLEVLAEAVDAESLLACAAATCPDLILLDWELPGLGPADLLAALRRACPAAHTMVLSSQPEAKRQAAMLGADAFVSKSYPPEELLAAIDQVRAHQPRALDDRR